MSENEDKGIYEIRISIKGKRTNAHFLVKNIENSCDLAGSILGKMGWKQKSLKRWQQVRPNKTEVGV